jgi:hypothetical protein
MPRWLLLLFVVALLAGALAPPGSSRFRFRRVRDRHDASGAADLGRSP